jgi:hypothetical protein
MMKSSSRFPISVRRAFRLLACLALGCTLCLVTSEVAWAKSKKKVVEVVETKSYVFPYILVISLVAVGVMSVCRPGGRLDKSDDSKKEKDEE